MLTHHPRSSRSPQDDRPTPCPVAGSSPRQDVVRRQVNDILAQLGNPDVLRIAAVHPRGRRDEATRSLEQPPRTERTQPTGGAQPSSRPGEIPRRGNLRRTNSSPSNLEGDPFLWPPQQVERSRRGRRVYPARRTPHTERVLGAARAPRRGAFVDHTPTGWQGSERVQRTGEAEATERAPRTEGFQLTQEVQQPRSATDGMRRFECPICLDTLEDPAGCGLCSGRFCFSCLEQMTNIAHNRMVSCPTCRRPPVRGTFQKDTRLKEEIGRAQVAQQVAEQVAQQMAEQGPHQFLERICQSLEVAAGTARDPMTTEPTVRFSSFRETNHCSTDVSVNALGDDDTGRDLVKKAQEKSAGRGDGVFAFSPEEVRKAKSGDAKLFFIIRHGRCFTRAEFFELTRAQMLILLGPQMVLPVIVCLQDVDKSLIPGVNMDEW